MEISASQVKELREKTGAGMMDCKKALAESSGDFEKAIDYLRKKGIAAAAKKAGRATKEGAVFSYIHGEGKVGVMVEVNCETDFVARTEQFRQFVKDVSMHIAAANPQWVRQEDVPAEVVQKEKEIAIAQMQNSGKPAAVLEKIAEGKLNKFFKESTLLNQEFTRDNTRTVRQYLQGYDKDLTVSGFLRYSLNQ